MIRIRSWLSRVVFTLPVLVANVGAPPARAQGRPPLPQILLRLEPAGASTDPDRIEVTVRLSGLKATAGAPFLDAPIVVASVPGPMLAEGDVIARDAAGSLPLTMTEDRSDRTAFGQTRTWSAGRASRGDITVHYAARIPAAGAPRRSGPPFDLRRENGGVSAAGSGFLVLPVGDRRYRLSIEWDLHALPAGSRGVCSLGIGRVRTVGTSDLLRSSYFMAGPIESYPANVERADFSAFWLGTPLFDARAVMQWTEGSYASLKTFFRDAHAPPFRVFARQGSIEKGGGASLTNSFMIGYGTLPQSEESLRFLLAHEMAHHWIGIIDGPPGSTSWFSEGLAEFYKLRLPLRAGLIDADAFATELLRTTAAYYANPKIRLPNDSVAGGFWSDANVRLIPYQRGLLYFADVDARVRAASQGTRSLDDLVHAVLDGRKRGNRTDQNAWLRIVTAALGNSARSDFDAMLGGALMTPPPNAFGPCLARKDITAANGAPGYEWVRVPDVPASTCALP